MKKTILKTVFSTLLTGVIVTGTVFAFTNTVPHKQDNQVVSAAEWNTIKTTIDNLKNSVNLTNYFTKAESTNKFIDAGDLTACKNGEVAKMTSTGFICVEMDNGVDAYTKVESDSKFIGTNDLTACKTGQVAKMTSTGFVCVEDQTSGSLPSCGSNQYLTSQSGKFVCKTLPASSGGSGLLQCPPRLTFTHDTTSNPDEYITYQECSNSSSGKLVFTLPMLLDDDGNSSSDRHYLYNNVTAAKNVCNNWGLTYVSHSLANNDNKQRNMFTVNYSAYIPFKQMTSKTAPIYTLICEPGNIKFNY